MKKFPDLKTVKKILAEIDALYEVSDNDHDSERAKVLDEEIENKREQLQEMIDSLKDHDVIKMITMASDSGFSPQTALGEWIHSWC